MPSFLVRVPDDRPVGEVAGEVVAVESGEVMTFRDGGALVAFIRTQNRESHDAPHHDDR